MAGPALATTFRHFCSTVSGGGAGLEVRALRRPELILRTTRYERIIVDESILTPVFPPSVPVRALAFVILAGRFVSGSLEATPGDVVFQLSTDTAQHRFEATHYLELEWDAPMTRKPEIAGRCDLERARRLAETMHAAPQVDVFREAFDFFRGAGLPLGDLDADRLDGTPTVLDQRLARAMEAQLENLSTRATTLHLEETSKVSPRHLQRLIRAFNARYGLNAGNWRNAGFPSPTDVRRQLGGTP